MTEIRINPNDPESIRRALNTEWLLTNGLGGYAMGTALGVNTRRYHGLLVAATKPPVGRIVALHSMIEQLVIPRADGSEEVIELSSQQFVGGDGQPMLHPNGWRLLNAFEIDANGTMWTWRGSSWTVIKLVNSHPGRNCGTVSYSIDGVSDSTILRLRPIIALRDFHALFQSGGPLEVEATHDSCMVRHQDLALRISSDLPKYPQEHLNRRWVTDQQAWSNFAYSTDRDRGQDWIEHLWSPGYFEARKQTNDARILNLRMEVLQPPIKDEQVLDRVMAYFTSSEPTTYVDRLQWAAKDFVVTRHHASGNATSVIAGYPWFGDWGRDTMIALPGLMLCTGRFDDARSTLLTFARHLRNGLIPNLFDDYGGAAHYNTVDASLWFVHAVHELWRAENPENEIRAAAPELPLPLGEGRGEGVRAVGSYSTPHVQGAPALTPNPSPNGRGELIAACRTIIAAYRNGTDFNIRMDSDSLIAAGDENSQLTWMDAKRDGVVFTPRHGKAVEINALWFNALRCMAEMTGDKSERDGLIALSEKVSRSFREKFWWKERSCLHDVLSSPREAASGQLRPNQILAVSLPFSPLDENQRRAVVKIVGDRLLTPYGLRTLDRDDPQYRGRYDGNLFERDAAYHNGTVWPWLIGPYCEALLRINKFSDDAKSQVKRIIQPLLDELGNVEGGRCLGQIAEVYDGDTPQRPSGCPAQAWSVAELLRIVTLINGE